MNPLDRPGTIFDLELMNPNPTSSKTASGPVYRISFELERDAWQCFMDAQTKGMVIAAKACVVDIDGAEAIETIPEKGPFGKEAAKLYRSGFARCPDVWAAVGTDEDYLDWCRQQPCCADGSHSGPVVAAHVRRVSNGSGMGFKPAYSAIPLCDQHHREQHQHGESAIGGKEWVDRQRIDHLQRWAWERLAGGFGVDSMTKVVPADFIAWAQNNNLSAYVPKHYGAG